MHTALACLLSLSITLLGASVVRAQAGRFIPIPRAPLPRAPIPRVPTGGGGSHVAPHVPVHVGGNDRDRRDGDNSAGWIILAILGAVPLVFGGWFLGRAIGRRIRSSQKKLNSSWPLGATVPPPMQDLILQPAEVANKVEQTRRLMEFLAHQDRALDPSELRQWIAMTFTQVQKAWEARDYSSVGHVLLPGILAKHLKLLASMREHHEINRLDDLRIERLEFVHLHFPRSLVLQEVTTLITFRTRSYFVDDRTNAYTRGLHSPSWFQEFWIFRRREDGWRLLDIEQIHESNRPERPNVVCELTDQQLANAQSSIGL